MTISTQQAIETLERFQNPEPWEPKITDRAYEALQMDISALEKQEQTNTQSVNSTHTSRPNALESLNILEQAKDDKGCVPMSLVRQAFRNVIEQTVDKCCETCKHKDRLVSEWCCSECYRSSNLEDYWEPYTEEEQ